MKVSLKKKLIKKFENILFVMRQFQSGPNSSKMVLNRTELSKYAAFSVFLLLVIRC